LTFNLTAKQVEANRLLGGTALHSMLFGGSRSGKTFLIVRAILIRAMALKSRHGIFRHRFNHLRSSIISDTLPKVMELCYPDLVDLAVMDKTDWFYLLPNGSEVWFGGLDSSERTEKVLGQEYASVYFNECSQISYSSRNIALTRLAQNVEGMRLRAYYDCNPPGSRHWTSMMFEKRLNPETGRMLPRPENFTSMRMNPADNVDNLPKEYIESLDDLPERMKRRFRDGLYADEADNALWTVSMIDQAHVTDGDVPEMLRIIISVDPSGCSGDEDKRSDEVGIIVAGLGTDGFGYILEDLSGRHGAHEWGKIVVDAYDRHEADRVVAETNYGGAMVGEIIRAHRRSIPFREVKATRGKIVRAAPVAALYEQGKIRHAGRFVSLENQLEGMTTAGYIGSKSPDRADSAIWAIYDLFPKLIRGKSNIEIQTSAMTNAMVVKGKLRGTSTLQTHAIRRR